MSVFHGLDDTQILIIEDINLLFKHPMYLKCDSPLAMDLQDQACTDECR